MDCKNLQGSDYSFQSAVVQSWHILKARRKFYHCSQLVGYTKIPTSYNVLSLSLIVFASGTSISQLYFYGVNKICITVINFLAGVSHGDDLGYTIKWSVTDPDETQEDKKMSQFLIDIWSSYAHNG
jgi:hypothetical protein